MKVKEAGYVKFMFDLASCHDANYTDDAVKVIYKMAADAELDPQQLVDRFDQYASIKAFIDAMAESMTPGQFGEMLAEGGVAELPDGSVLHDREAGSR